MYALSFNSVDTLGNFRCWDHVRQIIYWLIFRTRDERVAIESVYCPI